MSVYGSRCAWLGSLVVGASLAMQSGRLHSVFLLMGLLGGCSLRAGAMVFLQCLPEPFGVGPRFWLGAPCRTAFALVCVQGNLWLWVGFSAPVSWACILSGGFIAAKRSPLVPYFSLLCRCPI